MTITVSTAVTALLFATFSAFAIRRGMTYLHLYQQEEYDSPRFFKWMLKKAVFDKRLSAALILWSAFNILADSNIPDLAMSFAAFLCFAVAVYFEKDPRKDSKKKLAMTQRAQRIFMPAVALCIFSGLWCFLVPNMVWPWLICVHFIPYSILLVNSMLAPYEAYVQKQFWQEAHDKLQLLRPQVIAVTGSFGKTSVKHILGHILKMHAKTLITPGSVNTPMGITRIIREHLDETHRYFVVEMGAYGPGSIERLCALAPPDVGIITAIGHAHYERFKSLDTVAQTKYELAVSTLRKETGKMIVHERTLRYDASKSLYKSYAPQFIVCGDSADENASVELDAAIKEIKQLPSGLSITFSWKDETHKILAPIYGKHHGHNLVQCYVTALEIGLEPQDIDAALTTLPQIAHRLEVKKQSNGTLVIDDAYNSNPAGFTSALDLLGILGDERGGKKILITPGMVELGKAHMEAHSKIGALAAKVCDIAIIVKSERIPSFVEAFNQNGPDKILITADSFSEAQSWVSQNAGENDVILVENDLPDLYERVPKL